MRSARARALVGAATAPLATARVARWTWSGSRRLRRSLDIEGADAIAGVAPSPMAGQGQRATVCEVLLLARASCLVRAALRQPWDADHGRPRPLVIGVAGRPHVDFAGHAWLEGEDHGRFVELHRRPPPAAAGILSRLPDPRNPSAGRAQRCAPELADRPTPINKGQVICPKGQVHDLHWAGHHRSRTSSNPRADVAVRTQLAHNRNLQGRRVSDEQYLRIDQAC